VNYSLDFLRGMHGAPAEAADEIERLGAEVERLRAKNNQLQREVERRESGVYGDMRDELSHDLEAVSRSLSLALDDRDAARAEVERLRAEIADLTGAKE
jgi:FtsZ-binding cell division protein ZapB